MAGKKLPFKDFDDKIYVMLYGGKGLTRKETKESAIVVRCDKCAECSFYQNKTCLRTGGYFSKSICKYGKIERYEGYTPSAKSYYDWHSHFHEDEKYNALSYPSTRQFGVIGDYYVFDMSYVGVQTYTMYEKEKSCLGFAERNEREQSVFEQENVKMLFQTDTHSRIFLKKTEDVLEIINKLFSFVPRTIFEGAPIKEHSTDVTMALWMMKRTAPELYQKLIDAYPKYLNFQPNFVGRKAYVHTLKGGSVMYDCHHNAFVLSEDKTELVCSDFPTLLPFRAKTAIVTIPVTEDMVAEITNNDDVTDETKFE